EWIGAESLRCRYWMRLRFTYAMRQGLAARPERIAVKFSAQAFQIVLHGISQRPPKRLGGLAWYIQDNRAQTVWGKMHTNDRHISL
ncbi:MAG: hypothetical protein OWS74_05125, partial [Firmicutes bacterium]|nr:hypothetical protein [Bacillota bacterium]